MNPDHPVQYKLVAPILEGQAFKPDFTGRTFLLIEVNPEPEDAVGIYIRHGGLLEPDQVADLLDGVSGFMRNQGATALEDYTSFQRIVTEVEAP